MLNVRAAFLVSLCLAPTIAGQTAVCPAGSYQLTNDKLPNSPGGTQLVAPIAGLCPGDAVGVVFDLASLPRPIQINRAGILVAGKGKAVTGKLQVYEGVTFAANGKATLGKRIFSSAASRSLAPNLLTSIDVTSFKLSTKTTKLVVVFTLDTNPNAISPPFGCLLGYHTNYASDTNLPPTSACATRPGTNLIYDTGTKAWWDISKFKISGTSFCGKAFNGNWVVRACVTLPANSFRGTGEDLVLTSGINSAVPSVVITKNAREKNDSVTVKLSSPNKAYLGAFTYLLIDVYPTAGNLPAPILPGVHVGPTTLINGPFKLSINGLSITQKIPLGGSGLTAMIQGASFRATSKNGSYATTDAHVVRLR